ncbi:hypothetical protein ACIBG8_29580 [Nonomuraea sp. NPDC050556]|uniref:hypothetical protein n=1 Tax=Nonomuraea sp. NPDC050556 TaxID=3364369 RepID=UPI0037BE1C28
MIVQDGAATGLSEMRKVVIDHLDDETAAIVRRQATRTPEETRPLAALTPGEARG